MVGIDATRELVKTVTTKAAKTAAFYASGMGGLACS